MENVSTGLKWAIGILITLLIVAAGVSVYMLSSGYFKRAQTGISATTKNLTDVAMYDAAVLTGTDVLDAVNKFRERKQFTVRIQTGAVKALNQTNTADLVVNNGDLQNCYAPQSTSGNLVDPAIAGCTTQGKTMSDFQNVTKPGSYVSPSATFSSKIYYDQNGDPRLIVFTQQ
ncbi:hypothetical protein [Paenibacillus turpanensis]|uniref:hypothetical protein n=1 Tax=Paenibacillus turpanensis TaxID=2689078 RepID=UPI00140A5001|nr:hypothetical protein [Paenibacillus turpanensis]